jgi:hypothetical protein
MYDPRPPGSGNTKRSPKYFRYNNHSPQDIGEHWGIAKIALPYRPI